MSRTDGRWWKWGFWMRRFDEATAQQRWIRANGFYVRAKMCIRGEGA